MATIKNPDLYRFHKIPTQELSRHPQVIQQIYEDQLDGVVVEGLLKKDQLDSILAQFEREITEGPNKQYYYPAPFGHVFGTTLMESDLDGYFNKARLTLETYERMFSARFQALVIGALSRLAGKYTVFPSVHGVDQVFAMAGIRILEPGKDALEAHVHQEFPLHFPSYQAITAQLDLGTELSYYIVLQKPEEGGELVLFDLRWDQTPKEMLNSQVFLTGTRGQQLEAYDKMFLSLDPGDMILFAANRIWHKVAPVKRGPARITIGGFLAQHKAREEYGIFI